MQEVIEFILIGIKAGYDILNDFSITVYGFTFSMWDFLCCFFVLSCALPFLIAPRSSGSISGVIKGVSHVSDRTAKDKSDQKNSKK